MLAVWIAVIAAALIAEFATQVQLVSVWAAVGGIASLIALVCGADFTFQIVLFFGVTFAALILTRPFVKRLTQKVKYTPTNADMNIGKTGLVTKIVDAEKGDFRVDVNGEDWAAVTENRFVPEVGSKVLINEISGVRLIVSVIQKN